MSENHQNFTTSPNYEVNLCFSQLKDSGNIVEFDHGSLLLADDESIFKGMVDESKDQKQLYNSLKPSPTIKFNEMKKINKKMSDSRKIQVKPFDNEQPLETSF